MRVGYARVSTDEQSLDMQLYALKNAGCERIFTDTDSARKKDRPGLKELLSFVSSGDVIVVWHTSRLHRNAINFWTMLNDLEKREVYIYSTSQGLTNEIKEGMSPLQAASNKFVIQSATVMDEHLCNLISVNTKAGIERARANGKRLGAPPKLTKEQISQIVRLRRMRINAHKVAEKFSVSVSTIHHYTRLYETR